MKYIEYKPDLRAIRAVIFEALWPVSDRQRRQVIEEITDYNITLLVGTIFIIWGIVDEKKISIASEPSYRRMLWIDKHDILMKTEPIKK